MTQQPRRKRGVILTPQGKQKLLGAIREFESDHNFGEKYTIEELSGQTGLDPGTVAKVLDAEEGADRRTLDRFFRTFNLELTETDYRRPPSTQMIEAGGEEDIEASQVPEPTVQNRVDWGEAVDVSIFYGRAEELTALKQWIVGDRCRLVALLGMGGIGKTSLAAKLGEQIQGEFEYVVWRSLKDAPPLKDILTSLVQFVSDQQETEADLPEAINARITRLLEHLRNNRCLLVLDNAESILQEGQAGVYRESYEGYGELLKRVGEATHQSCLILTSREKPKELVALEGASLPVRCWQMRGIGDVDGQEILKIKGLELSGIEDKSNELIHRCAGNPLALKLVATTIQELFDGDIAEFLKEEAIAFDGIRFLLDQHFDRLSELEISVMYWLAINREPVTVQELQDDIIPSMQKTRLLEALKGLVERSLVERSSGKYTQQPVVMEYAIERLIGQFVKEFQFQEKELFNSYALIKASTKDYVRESQVQLILKPVLNSLITVFAGKIGLKNYIIKNLLEELRSKSSCYHTYAGGNILNLLCQMELTLSNYNFSNIAIWQAFLQGKELHHTNFSNSDLSKSVFTQDLGSISSISFNPDRELLAIVDAGSVIRLWQLKNTRQIAILQGHTSWIYSLAFSPDGLLLASSSGDGTIRIWDIVNRQCIQVLQGHTQSAFTVSFSPDGQLLASASGDCTVRIWDTSNYDCIAVLRGHAEWVRSVSFSSDSRMLASGSGDCTVKIWDIKNCFCMHTLQKHMNRVTSVTFSPNGQILASSSDNEQTIELWNTVSFQHICTLKGHTGEVLSIAFSPEGQILASGSADKTVKLWNIPNKHCLQTLQGHTSRIRSVTFSTDGEMLASGGEDQTVRLWDISTNRCLQTLQGRTNRIFSTTFSSDNQKIISSGDDQKIRVWDLNSYECIRILDGKADWIFSVALSPNRQIFASGGNDNCVRLWNSETYQCLGVLRGHSSWIYSVSFSPDGQLLASGSADKTIMIWNVSSQRSLYTLSCNSKVYDVAFSPDGQLLASQGYSRLLQLWETDSYEHLHSLQSNSLHSVSAFAFNPDGQTIASSGDDRTIRIWNISSYECIHIMSGHVDTISSISFSPDGKMIASAGRDQAIKLWDATTYSLLDTFQGHTNWVHSVSFSPNGQLLASCSEDGTIRLWNIQTKECLRVLRPPRPYERMDITGVKGVTDVQKAALIALGAIDEDDRF